MQPVAKRRRRAGGRRWPILALLVVLLAALVAAYLLLNRPEEAQPQRVIESGKLYQYEQDQIRDIRVTLPGGESWQVAQLTPGVLTLAGEESFQVSDSAAASLLRGAATISYERILTEDPADYQAHLADFGLAEPRLIAQITYEDGTDVTLRIGDKVDTGQRYMLLDGDERLFAVAEGTLEDLRYTRNALRAVTQPVLHKARMDRLTIRGAGGEIQSEWVLQGEIGGDAIDRWMLTAPITYPADGSSMDALLSNAANLRLGAWEAEATPDNMAAYGMDDPRWIIEIHMAEGAIGVTDASGALQATDYPESAVTFTIGAARDESVDYVMVDGVIYLSSHYSLEILTDLEPVETLTRYAVPMALGNLHRLTIESAAGRREYVLTRTEQVQQNNELVTDSGGNPVYDVTCQRDGQEMAYEAFEAAYNDLIMVRVSGQLPKGAEIEGEPHTTYTFEGWDGTVHTLALIAWDARHDALVLDGNAAFYLIQGGMGNQLE